MASQQSPTGLMPHHHHYGAHPPRPQPNGAMPMPQPGQPGQTMAQALASANEKVWLQIGDLSQTLGDLEVANNAYERALHFNQWSVPAMLAISCILRSKDQFNGAVEYLRQILKVDMNNGEVWSSLGHCYLMMDDLQQAYSAYQQALYHLPDPKEPKLWYGIGILYDRYGSLEHAEEAFSQVMRMEPTFEKANEIYFRLGIIYKQQQKFESSLDCFKYIVNDPPRPLSEEDIYFQIGHVHEQQKDYDAAKIAYTRVLERDPQHAKVLQQLGWLHHQQSTSFSSQEQAIEYLEKSVGSDQTDAQSWYLLGRCYMSMQKYPKAYEAYQQAVYRDGRNPTFWCSIGVLYYQINQYRDALDAYSRAIRLNPNISEVWYDLGTLYESCNNQTSDALDAYTRAAELDPGNVHIKARLNLLKNQATNGLPAHGNEGPPVPAPRDVPHNAYQPGAIGAGPLAPQWGAHAPNAPPAGPPPPPLAAGGSAWNNGNRLADLPPQPGNPYERDRMPQPQQQLPQRQPSPARQDPARSYADPSQRGPQAAHRGMSPSPKVHHPAPSSYGQGPPHSQGQPPLHHHQGHHAQQPEPPRSAYGAQQPNGPPANGMHPSAQQALPAYARQSEAQPEVRPIVNNAPPTPGGHFNRPPYEHHPNPSAPSIMNGAPPPSSAQASAEAAAREREERPPSVASTKRHRDWSEEPVINGKKPTTEEGRSRLDEIKVQRHSPSNNKLGTPPIRSPSELRRAEERPASAYHPSEAAHHPPALPSMASLTQPARMSAPPMEEQRAPPPPLTKPPQSQASGQSNPPPQSQSVPPQPQATPVYEPAARKMEVDENYDDSGDEDKRSATKQESRRNSPRAMNGQTATAVDTKA